MLGRREQPLALARAALRRGIDCAIQVGDPTDPSVVAVRLAQVARTVVASPALLREWPANTSKSKLTSLHNALMAQAQTEWLAIRAVHLPGGVRGLNSMEPRIVFYPEVNGNKRLTMAVRSYGSLYAGLSSVGLNPIGVDFVTNSLEAKALVPKNWRPYMPVEAKGVWPCDDQSQLWSQIAFSAYKAKKFKLWDLARRISHQVSVCAWRLREISDAFQHQLTAKCHSGFKLGERFMDGFTWLGYLSIQVFLVDACVLRDYLAEFYAEFACSQPSSVKSPVTSMGGLKKVLDRMAPGDPLADEIKLAAAAGGWLHKLGAYRDLVVHCVPLARSDSSLWALCTELQVKGADSIPAISFPIPEDPAAISRARASGAHFWQDELSLLLRANRGSAASTDGLIYAYESLAKLVTLTSKMAPHAPITPQVPHITEKDIIGKVKVTRI